MTWTVGFHEDFEPEFDALAEAVQDELLAEAKFVEKFGPETGRPHVDKLKGSHYANMKELRFEAEGGEWRVAFAFDPKRAAKADMRFEAHLGQLKEKEQGKR